MMQKGKARGLRIGLITAAVGMLPLSALAAHKPAMLNSLPHGSRILAHKAVKGTGLTAWLIGQNAHVEVVYSAQQGNYLINGRIYTPQGPSPVAHQLMQQYFSHHDFKTLGRQVQKATGIHQGHAGPVVNVFFDPNCIYCHRLWGALQSDIKAGKLQVNWIPVALIKPSSMGKSAAILASKNSLKALNQDETNFNVPKEEGGIHPMKNLTPKVTHPIKANTRMMHRFGLQGTPAIVYQNRAKDWHVGLGYMPASKLLERVNANPKHN